MSDGIKLASGYVELTVRKAGDAMKDITAEITGVGRQAEKVGKQAGESLSDGITKGARDAGKAINDEIGSAAEKAGRDAGKKAGDALGKEIEKASKNTKVAIPPPDTKSARDSIIRDLGGAVIDAAKQGARDAGVDLEQEFTKAAGRAGAAIGRALGNLPGVRDAVQAIGLDGDQAIQTMQGLGDAITGLKQRDAAGAINGVATALGGIGQSEAADVMKTVASRASDVQTNFSVLKDTIGGGASALQAFSGTADGTVGKLGSLAKAAEAAAGPLTAVILATQELQKDSGISSHSTDKSDWWHTLFGNSVDWFGGDRSKDIRVDPNSISSKLAPIIGLPQPSSAPVQGPHQVAPGSSPIPSGPIDYKALYGGGTPAPQTLLPPGVASAAPSAVVKQQSGSPLAAALAANGSFSPEQIRLIQGFSKVEGNNPAGNPTLGFTDSQLGGDASLQGHVNALAQQFRNRAPVAGPFPAGGSDQQQAAWIAAVVGQNGSPSDWQGNAQPPAAVYQQRIINSLPPIGFDDGGILPPGMTLTNNASGQPEIVLTQDQAKNAMQGMPGMGAGPSDTPPSSGMSPGPNGPAALTDILGGQQADGSPLGAMGAPGGKDLRTQGYIPAGAGGGGTAGTSLWSGSLQLGAQAINGLIEQAGSAAATAISAAATAGSFGAGGQAAGPASSFLIGIGTKMAERGVSYGFQLAGIAGDALAESLMPFGVPRLFQTSPQQFMPQLPGKPAATTTGEKAQQKQDNPAAANDPNINPAGPVQPEQMPGQQVIGPSAPIATAGTGNFKPEAPPVGPALSGGAGAPSLAPTQPVTPPVPRSGPMAAPQPQPQAIPPNTQPIQPTDLGGLLNVFDTGGWLMPGGLAANMTNKPEPILNPEQFDNLQAIASQGMPMPDPKAISGYSPNYSVNIDNVTVKDVDEMQRAIDSRQRLQMMRYSGRP